MLVRFLVGSFFRQRTLFSHEHFVQRSRFPSRISFLLLFRVSSPNSPTRYKEEFHAAFEQNLQKPSAPLSKHWFPRYSKRPQRSSAALLKRRIPEKVKEALESIDRFVKVPNLTKLNEDDRNFRFFRLNTDSAMFRDAAWIFDFSVGTLCINSKRI